MSSIIGIDVGGTFTDAVEICDSKIVCQTKIPTDREDLLHTIITALDALNINGKESLKHITVSTTLVTNAILQSNLPQVEIILFPGSGMKLSSLPWPVSYRILTGELDFRGREVRPPDKTEWLLLAEELRKTSSQPLVAIIGKFSHRNNRLEQQLAEFLAQEVPNIRIAQGYKWGQTNFYRRSLTTYLNLACQDLMTAFSSQLQQAIRNRRCQAPIRVLKADGGVLPVAALRPVESIYSGPAASVLGAMAQSTAEDSYIVVDVGGTTTDIGLVLSGTPLISSKGAQIGQFLTNIRSLAVRSVSVGGDSAVLADNKDFVLADYRLGPACCMGGSTPTPTDAMRYLNLIDIGELSRAEEALTMLLPENRRDKSSLRSLAESIIARMVEKIAAVIEQLLQEWKDEPAYKVWEVLHQRENIKFHIRLSGGGGIGICSALEYRMNTKTILAESAEFSNAVGAALAKPTFSWTMNLDTYLSRYRIEETGEQGRWTGSKKAQGQAEQFLIELAQRQAETMDIDPNSIQKELFDYFPLVEGYETVGQIVRGSAYVRPDVNNLEL